MYASQVIVCHENEESTILWNPRHYLPSSITSQKTALQCCSLFLILVFHGTLFLSQIWDFCIEGNSRIMNSYSLSATSFVNCLPRLLVPPTPSVSCGIVISRVWWWLWYEIYIPCGMCNAFPALAPSTFQNIFWNSVIFSYGPIKETDESWFDAVCVNLEKNRFWRFHISWLRIWNTILHYTDHCYGKPCRAMVRSICST